MTMPRKRKPVYPLIAGYALEFTRTGIWQRDGVPHNDLNKAQIRCDQRRLEHTDQRHRILELRVVESHPARGNL